MNIGKIWSLFILFYNIYNFSPRKLETADHLKTFFHHFKVYYLQRGKEHHNNTAVSEKGLIKKKKDLSLHISSNFFICKWLEQRWTYLGAV